MKNLTIKVAVAIGVVALTSCGADQETVNKMQAEMCECTELYNKGGISDLMESMKCMKGIMNKKDEYKSVSQAQLDKAMKENCSENYEAYLKMTGKKK